MLLINVLLSSLQQTDFTFIDNNSSTWLPIPSTAKHSFQNTNATQDRGKRETDNKPSHIAVLYPVDNNHRDGTQRMSKYKRCQGRIGKGNVHHDYFHKGVTSSNYMEKDFVNYYKSLNANDENGRNVEFRVDNDDVPKVKLTAAYQAKDNSYEANTPKSLASYIQQASNSVEGRGQETALQQLLTVGNGLKEQLKNNRREPTFNKHKLWKPSKDKNGYINTEQQNEVSTKPNTQTYSRFLSGSSTDPSHQHGLETSGTVTVYHYPFDDKKSMFQNLDMTGNFPLKERAYLKSTLPAKDLFKDNYFPWSTKYQSHHQNNEQLVDLDPHGNGYETTYWEPQTQNEYQDIPKNPELKHNMLPVTDSDLSMTGHTSEHTLNKGTGTNEDIRHNIVVNDIPLYRSSDDRRLMQGHLQSQNGINNSPYIQGSPSNMDIYLPGKPSGVLQEDGLLVHSIPGTNEMSIHYSEVPDVFSKKLKLSPSQDGFQRKDPRLTTENSVLLLPTASHNIVPSISHKHTPKLYSDFDGMLNNRDSPELENVIVSTHQDFPLTSHYNSHKTKIPSGELSCFTEIDEPSEDLQFENKNEDRISPENYKVPPIRNMPTWAGLMTGHSKYAQRVASTSPYVDEPERHTSNNGRNSVFKKIHFPTSTYQVIEENDDLPPQKSVPAPQRKTEPQLLHKRPTNYRLAEGADTIKVSVPQKGPFNVSTFISQISDISKYLPSASVPSLNKARTGIPWIPEGTRSVSSSNIDNGRFISQIDLPKSEPPFEVGVVLDRTKSEFSRMLQNTIHDSHSVPISSITSLEHGYLLPAQRSSINMETRDKSEGTFRPINTIVPQYPVEFKENLAGSYIATTNSPLLTTVTLRTHKPGSSEVHPQTAVLNDYTSETNMAEDVIPTLHSGGTYKTTLYTATETVTLEQNNDDVSNPATEFPYEFKNQFLNKISAFPESIQSDRNSGKEMQEKWTTERQESTSVMPNPYKMNKVQDSTVSTTDTSDNDANTEDMSEQTNWHPTEVSTDKVKNQAGSVPMNIKYEQIIRDEVAQGQGTKYPVTTMTDSLSDLQYIPVSNVRDIYVTTNKPDAQSAMALTAASDNYKNTYLGELVPPDKRQPSENEGNDIFLTARVSIPETMTSAVYINAGPPETLPSIQEQISHQLYTATVTPPETEVHETSKNTDVEIIQVPETEINYKGKEPIYTAGDELVATGDTGYEREQQILEKGIDYKSDKPITVHEFSENYEEQRNTQEDTDNVFNTKPDERPELKIIQVPETVADYRVNLLTQTAGNELVTPRNKEHEREQLILGKGADYDSDERTTAHQFSENYGEQTNIQKDVENIFMTNSNEKADLKITELSEPAINYKVNVSTYIKGDELVTVRGKGHEREQLILDEGDVYESDERITTYQLPDNHQDQMGLQMEFKNAFKTNTNEEKDSKIIPVPEPPINYKVKVPTYIMGDELATAARGKGHEREQVLDEGDVYTSDKQITTNQSYDNQEEHTDIQMGDQNTIMTKETENFKSPGILKAGTSIEKQNTPYLTALHIPNISDSYETKLSETTTFQTNVAPTEIMNEITVTSIPTEISDTTQNVYSTIQEGNESTDTLDKYNNDKSVVQKDDSQYLHAYKYDTSWGNHPTITPKDKYYNGEETRSSSNLKSGFEGAAVDVWNQNNAREVVDEQRNHSDDEDIHPEHVLTSIMSVDEEEDLGALHFIVPTLAPQQTGVTNNYIQIYETQMGESAQPLPDIQNKQNNIIYSEQSMNGYTLPLEVTDHADIPTLQHLTLGFQKSENLPIPLENVGDLTKPLQNTINSKNIMNKTHQDHDLIQDHNILQSFDILQPSVYTKNNLTQTQSNDDISTDINKTDYINVSELQTDTTTEHQLITYNYLNQKIYTSTPEAAGLAFNGIKSLAGKANMGHDVDHQRHESDGYMPQIELSGDPSAAKHDYFDSYNIQLPKGTEESKNMDLQKLESSIIDTNKQKGTENIIQVANPYPNIEGHDITFVNEDDNDKQVVKFETEDSNRVLYGHEKSSSSYNRQLIPESNTDSSTLQFQNPSKNAERFHSASRHTAESKHTNKLRNEECYMHCNILNSQPKETEDRKRKEGTRKPTLFPPEDTTGILPEYIRSRNGTAGSMELAQPDDLGEILKPIYVTRIVAENEKPEGITGAAKEYKPNVMRVMTENRQAGGDRTEHKQMEQESEDITDYQGPEEITVQDYDWLGDPVTARRDHNEHEYELQGEYTTQNHKVLQPGVVTERTTLQDASKRTRNTQNFYTTNAIRQSGEDTRNAINDYKNTITFLLQNKEKIQLLLDLPYSYAMTTTPAMTKRRESQSQLEKEVVLDQDQVEAMNLALNKTKPIIVDYSSVEITGQPKHVIMDSVVSNYLSHLASLREKNRQAKSFEDMHTVKSERCKTKGTFNDECNLRAQETMQQSCIPRKEYSSPMSMAPSVNVDKSEVLYKRNKEPKQQIKLRSGIRDSDDTWGTAINLAHLPSQNSMGTERSDCGPWGLYKNYLCMPAASPRPDHHSLISDDERVTIHTVPTYSFETNISDEPGYGYVMDSSLEPDKMAQDSSLDLHSKHHIINYNIQRSDVLSEKEMALEKNIIDYDEENQSLSDDSMIDTYNAFDSPQLFKLHVYDDDRNSQSKLYDKRKSNSNHNIGYIPENSYQKLIKDSVMSSRPVSMGNWKKYKGSPEEIIHLKPSAFKNKNYKPYSEHSSDENNKEESTRSFLLGFKKSEINKRYNDDSVEIGYYKSGKKEREQPPEWEIFNTDNRQSSFSEAYDHPKEHSWNEDCSEETITQASPEMSLKNANELFDGDIIHMPVNGPSYNTEVFNSYSNNYKKKFPSEQMQISKNIYKYSNDYKYPIKHHKLPVTENRQQDNDVRQTATHRLLHWKNNNIFHQPENNDNSWDHGYETDEIDDSVIRRTRNAVQYTTVGSSEKKERDSYPQYQSRSCQSYNCEGVLASEVKIVTAILKWLKGILTDTQHT
jgi:hypothetical protein